MTDQNKKRIGIIFGGKSSEKEVSLATGRYLYQLLDPAQFIGVPVFMDSKGLLWVIPEKLIILNQTQDIENKLQDEARSIHFEDLSFEIDLMFIALLGKYGEDGVIQGILELLHLPYTGSGILSSAIGMNKKVHKKILQSEGFLVPKDICITKKDWESDQDKVLTRIKKEMTFPCVVKPICEGSSVGVSVPKEDEELIAAIDNAFFWDPEVLIEEFITGKEFMCVVWGNQKPEAMLPTEVVFEGDFHTYESKYMPGRASYFTPIRVPDEIVKKVQDTAVSIYKLLKMKGYGRVDGFVVEKDGQFQIYIGEPHTGTIMVPSSYVFQQAAKTKVETKTQAGSQKIALNPRTLVSRIIELAFEAHQDKKGYL